MQFTCFILHSGQSTWLIRKVSVPLQKTPFISKKHFNHTLNICHFRWYLAWLQPIETSRNIFTPIDWCIFNSKRIAAEFIVNKCRRCFATHYTRNAEKTAPQKTATHWKNGKGMALVGVTAAIAAEYHHIGRWWTKYNIDFDNNTTNWARQYESTATMRWRWNAICAEWQ